ncbi:scarecrow-like protein 18 [Malus domestica]|uniref:Lateral suppressor protein n=1 Tax=Malus domestica TaxID=3750 RepID=M4PMF0_MALDO|nr:scarecrow-like protein 18 [Malus domestica]AGH06216.1 lateral suppressor protein [Malus domestica]
MGSFNSSHIQQEEKEDHQNHPNNNNISDLQLYHHHHDVSDQPPLIMSTSPNISPTHLRHLLITCAELISHLDSPSANRLISLLSSNSSPFGDSTERLTHYFVKALSFRLNTNPNYSHTTICPMTALTTAASASASSSSNYLFPPMLLEEEDDNEETLHSCYLTLNQITPFIRFSHLTANQAILESIDSSHLSIHILDFDIMHGVQWPPLMQALVERSYNSPLHPPPTLRITATGRDLTLLLRTGERLLRFAQSLGLAFQFHPLVLNNAARPSDLISPSTLGLHQNEALAVNCVLYLHTLVTDDSRDLLLFLQKIKSLNPKVFTVANKEANHNNPLFFNRFVEALDHYGAVFESLEATLPPNSRERLAVEEWFGREVKDVVGVEGEKRKQRHERYETFWEVVLRRAGFENVALSPFALSQAKLLLRLHYPSEGYQLRILNDSFFLGWQNRPLFSVSSWH